MPAMLDLYLACIIAIRYKGLMNYKNIKLNEQKILTYLLLIVMVVIAPVLSHNRWSGDPTLTSSDQDSIAELKVDRHSSAGHLVTNVVDGDTFDIEGGYRVRLIGVDAPESVHPFAPVECFGPESSEKLSMLILDQVVHLEQDVSETDQYGRLLRYVYLGELFVNDYLVRQGYAVSSSYPPDVKHQSLFRESEALAREEGLGLWSDVCENWESEPAQVSTRVDADGQPCLIKGNINSSGEKIYHLPGQYYYESTVIDESRGQRWFCTEEEAQLAGWRKARR